MPRANRDHTEPPRALAGISRAGIRTLHLAEPAPLPPPAPPRHANYFREHPFMQIVIAGQLQILHACGGQLRSDLLKPGDAFFNLSGGWDQRCQYGRRKLLTIWFRDNRIGVEMSYRLAETPPEKARYYARHIISPPPGSGLAAVCAALTACAGNPHEGAQARLLFQPLAGLLLAALAAERPQRTDKAEKKWLLVMQYLAGNSGREINRTEVAREFELSPDYLGRLCQRQTGVNFVEFLRRLRMEKARRILAGTPGITVKQLARECGFAEAGYFIKVYRKHFGHTPKCGG